jgi:hypothetical protein
VTVSFAKGVDKGTEKRILLQESKRRKISVTRSLQTSSGSEKTSVYEARRRGGGLGCCSWRLDTSISKNRGP